MFFTNCYPKSMYDATAVCHRMFNYDYLIYGLLFIIFAASVALAVTLVIQYRNHRRLGVETFIGEEYLPAGLYGEGSTDDPWEPGNPFLEVDDRADNKYL